jgi:allophanate hydrolase
VTSPRRASALHAVTAALDRLAGAPPGILIGAPLGDAALAAAARVDRTTSHLPLRGMPYVIKDNIDVAGVTTTAACPGFAYVAARDATIVTRLAAAGAICVGKANLDQFATGLVGTRSPYGTPPNALDRALVPGGSSSGSAVAVALDLVPFAIGTDTAGSGRVPAALNGIVGAKPTVGRIETDGFVPAIRRFDCPSVFARHVEDAATILHVLAGQRAPRAAPWDAPAVGVPSRWPAGIALDPVVATSFAVGCAEVDAVGGRLVDIDVEPLLALGQLLYGSALLAERAEAAGPAVRARLVGLDPTVTAIVDRALAYSTREHEDAVRELDVRLAAAAVTFDVVDVVALPTTPFLPTIAEVAADPIGTNERLGAFTTFANLVGCPVVVLPSTDRSPTGLQLVGAPGSDDQLLALARRIEDHRLAVGVATTP